MSLLPEGSFCKRSRLSHEGKFGNNVIAQTTLLKYEDRITHRNIHDAMMRLCGLKISPATIFDLTRRAADAIQSEYDAILNKNVDETSIHVQGERHWIWTFSTPLESFFVIRKSRGMKVLTEVLTQRFKGIIVCDGWNTLCQVHKSHSAMLGTFASRVKRDG